LAITVAAMLALTSPAWAGGQPGPELPAAPPAEPAVAPSPEPAVAPPTGPAATPPEPAVAPPAEPAVPPPYSVPWQLRPIVAPTVIRSDTSFAFYEDPSGRQGTTVVSVLTASYRVSNTGPPGAGLAPVVRLAFVTDNPPPGQRAGATVVNPLAGAGYAIKLEGGVRLNAFLGVTAPVGGGGGNSPSPGPAAARVKGLNARAQLDNALFAVNDFTIIPGFGAAYVNDGLTVQGEVTLLQLLRVRGAAAQPDERKTNMTAGVHVGYFFLPFLSVGTELRYQRWLDPPAAVEDDPTGATRDTLSVAIGPRAHFKIAPIGWLRPGLSYQRGLDKPMAASSPNYHVAHVDIPFFF
jgi:hypothetical protein